MTRYEIHTVGDVEEIEIIIDEGFEPAEPGEVCARCDAEIGDLGEDADFVSYVVVSEVDNGEAYWFVCETCAASVIDPSY